MIHKQGEAKFAKKAILIGGPIVIIAIGIWIKPEKPIDMVIGAIGSSLLFGYYYLKYFFIERAEGLYLNALNSKNTNTALHYGRIYYSLRRGGLMGGDGSKCNMFDEQAIANDINNHGN